jgi:CDP-glycerol glycerophosphotransferase (TagB/SpsB family)
MSGDGRDCINMTDELRKALAVRELSMLLLQGNIGAFSLRQLFINSYINYVVSLASDPMYSLDSGSSLKNYDSNRLIQTLKAIFFNHRKCLADEHNDILILSRMRNVRVKTIKGEISGDYVFFSIVEDLKCNHNDIKFKIYQYDDLYFCYEHTRPMDLLRALIFALEKNIQWRINKKAVQNLIRSARCINAESYAQSFFSIRPLIRMALYAYDFDNFIRSSNPEIILANDDCLYTKPLNRKSAKVLVLQSASVGEALEECRSLIFEEEDLLPDYYLSSGSYFADIKKRYHIAKNVIATGLPRYDVLHDAPCVYNRDAFFREHRIDPRRKMLFWATQSHVISPEENLATAKAVLVALKELEDVILVIKQHPAEGDEYSKFLKHMIDEYHSDAILVSKNADTYELLSVCDLHITRTSTTAREAVAMNKPVIILYLDGQLDGFEYIKEGVALGVYSSAKLKDSIVSLLKDDFRLRENRKRYIEKYLYRIDGKATERVVNLMIEMLHRE